MFYIDEMMLIECCFVCFSNKPSTDK